MSNKTNKSKSEAPAGSLARRVSCRVCQTPTEPDNLTHLKIYVAGSEGVDVCITCRQVLTEVLRGMMRTCIAGKKQGYLAAKQVAAAKAANHQAPRPAGKDDTQ